MNDGMAALRAERAEVLEVCEGLTAEDWAAPSGCPGWSVLDVISHLAALYGLVIDPAAQAELADRNTEEAQEALVVSRRDRTPAQVVEEYATVSEQAFALLDGLADAADLEIPLGDLGTYRAPVLPTSFAFDHYAHLRADLFPPRGPLTGPVPPSDALRMGAALTWIEAALPQQNPKLLAELGGAVELVITGDAARTITIGSGPVRATITSDADTCVRWTSQRRSWEELGVEAEGDEAALAVARQFKVF